MRIASFLIEKAINKNKENLTKSHPNLSPCLAMAHATFDHPTMGVLAVTELDKGVYSINRQTQKHTEEVELVLVERPRKKSILDPVAIRQGENIEGYNRLAHMNAIFVAKSRDWLQQVLIDSEWCDEYSEWLKNGDSNQYTPRQGQFCTKNNGRIYPFLERAQSFIEKLIGKMGGENSLVLKLNHPIAGDSLEFRVYKNGGLYTTALVYKMNSYEDEFHVPSITFRKYDGRYFAQEFQMDGCYVSDYRYSEDEVKDEGETPLPYDIFKQFIRKHLQKKIGVCVANTYTNCSLSDVDINIIHPNVMAYPAITSKVYQMYQRFFDVKINGEILVTDNAATANIALANICEVWFPKLDEIIIWD